MNTPAVRTATYTPLINQLWPAGSYPALRVAALMVLGSLLLTASAKAHVPMWPVPMTMQTFVVLVLGMTYGMRLGAATVALYLFEGTIGMPVFSGTPERGIGLAYMMGPTGGYLLGFLIATALIGWLAERGWDRTLPYAIAAMTIGTIVQLVPGVAYLAALVGSWDKAIAAGLTPFLAGAVVKLALAAAVLPLAWRVVDRKKV